MNEITLTLKHDTVEGIISMIENRIDNLQYKKLEMYRGQPIEKELITISKDGKIVLTN